MLPVIKRIERATSEAPHDWGLNGYFFVVPDFDTLGTERQRDRVWKNTDFLRLKDRALMLLGAIAGKRVLDLGCSEGATMVYCGLQGAEVHGIDLNPTVVATANARLRRFGISGEARVADATAMPYDAGYFDAAISNDFFEHVHVEDKVAALRDVRRVLKPGAPIVIKTPNLRYLQLSLWYKRARALARLRNPFRVVIPMTPGHDDPQHIGLTTRWELTDCLVRAGFGNYEFVYAPLRRFGTRPVVELLSTEVPIARDFLCEDIFVRAYCSIIETQFPD